MINTHTKHLSIIGLFAVSGAVLPLTAHAAHVSCGDTITSNTKLDADLNCATDPALTVQGPAKLDLDGFTVSCTGSQDGIELTGRGAKLEDGTVKDCVDGVRLLGDGEHKVVKVTAEDNADDGFDIRSDDNKLVRSQAISNFEDGIHVDGGEYNEIVNNFVDDSGDEGICLDNGENNKVINNVVQNSDNDGIELDTGADETVIASNVVADSDTDGIDIDSDDNIVEANNVTDSGDDGINLQDGATGNRVAGNKVFDSDDFDMEDDNADCDNNTWVGNQFETSDPTNCIN